MRIGSAAKATGCQRGRESVVHHLICLTVKSVIFKDKKQTHEEGSINEDTFTVQRNEIPPSCSV